MPPSVLRKWPLVLGLLCLLSPVYCPTAPAMAAEPALLDVSDKADGEYPALLVVKGGQLVEARPLRTVKLGGGPTSPPTNPPPTSDTPLQSRVKQLTREALAAGGKPATAARLAGVYALVSDFCLDGTVSPDMVRGTPSSPGFLTAATDQALKDASDKGAWTAWRQGIGNELALRHPAGVETTKEALAKTLAEVSSAVKSHLSSSLAAAEKAGDAKATDELNIDWTAIIELLRPILRELLLKFLTDWINKPK